MMEVLMDSPDLQFPNRSRVSGLRRILRRTRLAALVIALLMWGGVAVLLDKNTWIDEHGLVHEPLFGLIPLGWFFGFLAVVLAVVDLLIAWFRKPIG